MSDHALFEKFHCPVCDKRPALVIDEDGWFHCKMCKRYYPLKDGIPRLIFDEAVLEKPQAKLELS